MKLYNEGTRRFEEAFSLHLRREGELPDEVRRSVSTIIESIRSGGDASLFELTNRYDGFDPGKRGLSLSRQEMEAALGRLPKGVVSALEKMAGRIREFHENQVETGYSLYNDAGGALSLLSIPVDRAGIYIPGGKAAYPSTALMNAIPARVAGVREVLAAAPAPGGAPADEVLAACYLAGVDRLFMMGGAQAVAAFAYGTESVPRVDVIAGPGNAFVTEAKRQLFGTVGIDMLAGPSELVVLADSSANPDYVAYDMVSQAEHGEDTFVALVTNSSRLAKRVIERVELLSRSEKRRKILSRSLREAPVFVVKSVKKGVELVRRLAPEHLSVQVDKPDRHLAGLTSAGTIFIGPYSPVAVGDYIAGINHTLPTGGSARFSSPLGVYNFIKRLNLVSYGPDSLKKDLSIIRGISRREGLTAHGNAASARFKKKANGRN